MTDTQREKHHAVADKMERFERDYKDTINGKYLLIANPDAFRVCEHGTEYENKDVYHAYSGWKAAQEAMQPKWISVEDRLPDEDVLVLVTWVDDDDFYTEIDYMQEGGWADWFNRAEHLNIAGGNLPEEAPYTHWMSLQDPPKK